MYTDVWVRRAGGEGALYVAKPWNSVEADEWRAHSDVAAVICSLDPRGRSEGLLRQQMCKSFAVSAGDYQTPLSPLIRVQTLELSGALSCMQMLLSERQTRQLLLMRLAPEQVKQKLSRREEQEAAGPI